MRSIDTDQRRSLSKSVNIGYHCLCFFLSLDNTNIAVMAHAVRFSNPSTDGVAYRHLYSRGTEPLSTGAEVRELVTSHTVPPCTMRWRFETKFKRQKSGNKNVILKHILETCQEHQLEPISITNPSHAGPGQYVDVLFANGDDLMKAWNAQLSFDFYGTQPSIVGRGSKLGSDVIAIEIKTLPARTDLTAFVQMLQKDDRLRQAGEIIDVWAAEKASDRTFQGIIFILFQVKSVAGVPSVAAKVKIPGHYVINEVAYPLRYAGRPDWCRYCRNDGKVSFHSVHACPKSKCITCGHMGHSSVACEVKRKARQGEDEGAAEAQAPSQVDIPAPAPAQQPLRESISDQQVAGAPHPQQATLQVAKSSRDTTAEGSANPSETLSQTTAAQDQGSEQASVKDAAAAKLAAKKQARFEKLKQNRKEKKQLLREQAAAQKAQKNKPEAQKADAQGDFKGKGQDQAAPGVSQTVAKGKQAQAVKQPSNGPASNSQAPSSSAQKAQESAVRSTKASGPKSQAQARRQAPENLPKKQLQYIKAMERRLLRLCLEDANADVSELVQSMGVVALSSDDDSDL